MDFIQAFMEETEGFNSPVRLRRWGAIAAVSGALERKVWIMSRRKPVFPNMYILIVAPSAGGKSEVTGKVEDLWRDLENVHVASSSVTRASFIDELNEAKRVVTRLDKNPPVIEFNSLLFCSNELGVLLPSYDMAFMATLTDLYDCKTYGESRRGKKEDIYIERPHVAFLAACVPDYLRSTLPEGAWEQGFASRTVMIFSGEKMPNHVDIEFLDEDEEEPEIVQKNERLLHCLQKINQMTGKMKWSREAGERLIKWNASGQAPVPDHPKLMTYVERRYMQVLKLSMIICAAQTQRYEIQEEHVSLAIDWLTEAEHDMPEIFKAMRVGGDGNVIRDTYHFVYKLYMKEQKPVAETRLWSFVQDQTHAYNVKNIITSMVNQGLLKETLTKTGKGYKPGERKSY